MRARSRTALLVALAVAALAAGGSYLVFRDDDAPKLPPGRTLDVRIDDLRFPAGAIAAELTVPVRFDNADDVAHTVTSDDGLFDSGPLEPGKSFSYAFSRRGTFRYHCEIHPAMKGSVVVR
jgi:plastocyanin